jgi:hypothetical protein
METRRHSTGLVPVETSIPPVASIFLKVGLTATSRCGGMRAASGSMSCLVYKGTRSLKTDQSCRLLVEELPLAGLHKDGHCAYEKLSWLSPSGRPFILKIGTS